MPVEIERKFLVSGKLPIQEGTEIQQAYLCLDPERTIRVRIDDGAATLNIKGKTKGISRQEFEYGIPLEEAQELMKLALGHVIHKTRMRLPQGQHLWEIDVFQGANDGLIVAEIELESEDTPIDLPDWIGEDVSHDPRYLNACLAQAPFSTW